MGGLRVSLLRIHHTVKVDRDCRPAALNRFRSMSMVDKTLPVPDLTAALVKLITIGKVSRQKRWWNKNIAEQLKHYLSAILD